MILLAVSECSYTLPFSSITNVTAMLALLGSAYPFPSPPGFVRASQAFSATPAGRTSRGLFMAKFGFEQVCFVSMAAVVTPAKMLPSGGVAFGLGAFKGHQLRKRAAR